MHDKKWPLEFRSKLDSIQENILTYLSHSPVTIRSQGPQCLGDVSLSLGNCLVWIAGALDPLGFIEEPVGQQATTVHSLGKQFQVVGRLALDRDFEPQEAVQAQIHRLSLEMQSLRKIVARGAK